MSPYNVQATIVDAREGRVTTGRTKVAIVGAGYGKQFAPLTDDTWEVWALNAVPVIDHANRLRADRWFEIHARSAQSVDDMKWITTCPFPLYLPPAWANRVLDSRVDADMIEEDVPNAVAYPLDRIEKAWGRYFTCTFAYQIALALDEGFDTIGLYGVELAYGTERERTVEWACVSFWIGLALGLGKHVLLPPGTRLGNHQYRYGIEYDAEKAYVERYLETMRKGDEQSRAMGMGG